MSFEYLLESYLIGIFLSMSYWGIDLNANSIESTILRDPQHSHIGW